jgi:hypothetical protein
MIRFNTLTHSNYSAETKFHLDHYFYTLFVVNPVSIKLIFRQIIK